MEQERPPVAPPRTSTKEEKAKKFMDLHNTAYEMTNAAIKLDEDGKFDQAFNGYQQALCLIDKAVDLAHSGGFPEDKVAKIDDLLYKMRMSRKEILERVSDISMHQNPASTSDYLQGPANIPPPREQTSTRQPPTYESLCSEYSATESQTQSVLATNAYSVLNASLDEIAGEEGATRNPLPINAQEVFSIQENVQIYFISNNDMVSAPSYPSFLRVVVINHDEPHPASQPPAFLQVGDWNYPLWPGQSPVLEAADGSYIFPDLESPGGSVGLILPESLPIEQKKTLEDLMLQLIGQAAFHTPQTQIAEERRPEVEPGVTTPTDVPQTLGSKIASGLMTGAEKVAHGLAYGAERTSEYMERGAAYLVTKMEPAQEKASIHPDVRSGMKTARNVTGKAVKVSGFLVNQLGKGTLKLGQYIAPYVHRTATKLYAKTLSTSQDEAAGKMGQVFEVTGGAVAGFGTVFMGLEHAAFVLAKSIGNNTVTVVQHRYGPEAGSFCEDTTSTLGNSVLTGYNVKGFAPKALAKRVAKDAGRAIASTPLDKSHLNNPPKNT